MLYAIIKIMTSTSVYVCNLGFLTKFCMYPDVGVRKEVISLWNQNLGYVYIRYKKKFVEMGHISMLYYDFPVTNFVNGRKSDMNNGCMFCFVFKIIKKVVYVDFIEINSGTWWQIVFKI